MKMASRFNHWPGFVTLLVLTSAMFLRAETPARPRGNAIIFSAPKSDTVSSNLNSLRSPASPFQEMESTLKKPFELFEPNLATRAPKFVPPPQQELRKKPLKDTLNARAEEMFLEPKLHEGETEGDIYKSGEDSSDPLLRKPKTALDRYYDRMDRALTNRVITPNSIGAQDSLDPLNLNRNTLNPFADDRDSSNQRKSGDNKLRSLSAPDSYLNNSRENVFGSRTSDHSTTFKPDPTFSGYREQKENRLDTFRKLLDGPSQTRTDNLNPGNSSPSRGSYATTPTRPTPYSSPTATSFGAKSTSGTTPANAFTKSAGLIGAPGTATGLPDYTASTSTLTPPPKPTPTPGFNPPKRRF